MAMLAMVGATATAQEDNDGLTASRPLTSGWVFSRYEPCHTNGACLLPYGLDVTFDKTVHLIFPSAIRYVDLGSQNIIAGKGGGCRERATCKGFGEGLWDGNQYECHLWRRLFLCFQRKVCWWTGKKLSIEMKDFLSPTDGQLPSNRSDIYFKELGNESPVLVKLMMQTIYQNDKALH